MPFPMGYATMRHFQSPLPLLLTLLACCASSQPLPPLSLSSTALSISGISSGAFFAVQLQFSHSSIIRGAGIVAGGPYYCAQQGGIAELAACSVDASLVNTSALVEYAEASAAAGLIDPLPLLKNHTVHLFSGTIDSIISHGTMITLADMYARLEVPCTSTFNFTAEHAWVTSMYGNNCSYLGPDFINNCGWDFAGRFLSASFAAAKLPWVPTPGVFAPSHLRTFDQAPFGAETNMSMDTTGYIYIPAACEAASGACKLHVNFHGCDQSRTEVADAYVSRTQLNEWAEANNIVVLYPQAAVDLHYANVLACWNSWGYGDAYYATKLGKQVATVKRMIDALLAPPAEQ